MPAATVLAEASAADAAFSAALTSAFGRDAVKRRYSYERADWPAELTAAHERFRTAAAAVQAAFEAERAAYLYSEAAP